MCHNYLLEYIFFICLNLFFEYIYNIFRRMFPTLKIKISGMEEDVEYSVGLEIRSVDCKRYRYVYQRWDVSNGLFSARIGQKLEYHGRQNMHFWWK